MSLNSNLKSKFLNRMFRRISGVVWDMTTGSQGLKVGDEIYSVTITPGRPATDDGAGTATAATESTFQTSVNPFGDLGMALPAFATQVPFEDVSEGDLVVGANKIIGWVVGKTAQALKVVDHNGMVKTYVPPKVAILGNDGVLVVQNLFSLTGGASGAGSFANSLLPMLMLGGGDDKLEKLLPLLLMQSATAAPAAGAAAAPAGINPMMLLAMTGGLGGKKSGDGIDPMMLLAMTGGLGGGAAGGMNPLVMASLMGGDLFGTAALDVDETAVPTLRPLSPPPLRPIRG